MSEVTARPWKQGKPKEKKNFVEIPIEQGMAVVCYVVGSTNPMIDWYQGAAHVDANARHIVHCVNNHERLVAMLRELVETEDDGLFEMLGDDYCERLNELLAALEAEKGGEL